MPPNPTVGVDGAVSIVGDGLPKLPPKLGVLAAGAEKLGVEGMLGDRPVFGGSLLAAPATFSCVLPHAAIPRTAPIAKWNKPAPCSVNGFHCVTG